jgi:chitin disaccharide deacetylase
LQAQLERLLAAGIHPTHLDSHHHVHTEWAIAPLVCRLARAYGVGRVRLTRNMGLVENYPRRLYKKVFNRWYLGPRSGLANTDYFGDVRDMKIFSGAAHAGAGTGFLSSHLAGRSFEIMVHPLFADGGRLVDYDQTDLQQELMPILHPDPNPSVLTY